jgi:hypothetical protein
MQDGSFNLFPSIVDATKARCPVDYSEIKRDLYIGIASMAFSIFYGISTILTVKSSINITDSGRIFPYIITALLFIISAMLILDGIKKINKIPCDQRTYMKLMKSDQALRIIIYVIALSLYIFGFIYVGYIVSTTLYLAFLLSFMNAKNKIAKYLIMLIAPAFLWFFFTIILEVQFPETLLI